MYKCNEMNKRLINIVRLQSKKFISVDGKNKLKFQVCHTTKTYHIPQFLYPTKLLYKCNDLTWLYEKDHGDGSLGQMGFLWVLRLPIT